jgi:Xaa-Pro aminopeptidase
VRVFLSVLALWAAGGAVCPASEDRLRADERMRREQLRKDLPDGVTVLFGRTEKESDDLRTGFFQEPNFRYLTGWLEPGAILMMTSLPEDRASPGYAERAALPREILFLPRRNPDQEKWTGRKLGPEEPDAQRLTGFDMVLPAENFESEFHKMLAKYPRLYALKGRPEAAKLQALAPLRDISDAALPIARLRMKKSAEELALLEKATDATLASHRAAWKRAAPGLYEYQVAATMVEVYQDHGCERSAYEPIVGSGPNAVFLHYSRNSRRMDRGELLLMDVGAECSGYAADITRTIPVGGRFSRRQREIYEVVLGAQKAVIAAVKPGVTIGKTAPNSVYTVAYEYINSHGKDLHGEPLGKYFTHGVSHHVGLEVHDAADPNAPLAEGMVITVEPGIYIPEENIGIRIEDMVLVTRDGAKVLSAALPREPGEIERAIAK